MAIPIGTSLRRRPQFCAMIDLRMLHEWWLGGASFIHTLQRFQRNGEHTTMVSIILSSMSQVGCTHSQGRIRPDGKRKSVACHLCAATWQSGQPLLHSIQTRSQKAAALVLKRKLRHTGIRGKRFESSRQCEYYVLNLVVMAPRVHHRTFDVTPSPATRHPQRLCLRASRLFICTKDPGKLKHHGSPSHQHAPGREIGSQSDET